MSKQKIIEILERRIELKTQLIELTLNEITQIKMEIAFFMKEDDEK